MTEETSLARNPFALLVDPQAVIAAVEKSERLGSLNRHLCRPLDRQLPNSGGTSEAGNAAPDAFDSMVDSEITTQ